MCAGPSYTRLPCSLTEGSRLAAPLAQQKAIPVETESVWENLLASKPSSPTQPPKSNHTELWRRNCKDESLLDNVLEVISRKASPGLTHPKDAAYWLFTSGSCRRNCKHFFWQLWHSRTRCQENAHRARELDHTGSGKQSASRLRCSPQG